jgi:hypothetical protein
MGFLVIVMTGCRGVPLFHIEMLEVNSLIWYAMASKLDDDSTLEAMNQHKDILVRCLRTPSLLAGLIAEVWKTGEGDGEGLEKAL